MTNLARGAARAVAVILASIACGAPSPSRADELPRRVYLGAQVAALPTEARARLSLPDSVGVEVQAALPGSAAERIGLRAGDVITTVAGAGVASPAGLVARIAGRRAGQKVAIAFVRNGAALTKSAKLTEVPRESSDAYDVVYASVTTRAGRLRTIVTKPRARGPHPAFFLIQGIGGFTVERGPGGMGGYARIIEDFAARGFVTLRVDKPGCGDSEGGPIQDVDFETQMDGFRQALAMLRADPDVDPGRILVFGHSMGGVWGPLLARETPVRGLAVYGTIAKTWLEYSLENGRRQLALAGSTPASIDSALRQEAAGEHYVCVEKMTPRAMVEAYPDLAAWVDSMFVEQTYYSGLHYAFLQQLADKNIAGAWESFAGRALAVWGKADFISGEEDHALIARIVNARSPGNGEFVALDNSDHGFYEAATPEESFASWGQPGRALNPAIVTLLREWSDRALAGPKD